MEVQAACWDSHRKGEGLCSWSKTLWIWLKKKAKQWGDKSRAQVSLSLGPTPSWQWFPSLAPVEPRKTFLLQNSHQLSPSVGKSAFRLSQKVGNEFLVSNAWAHTITHYKEEILPSAPLLLLAMSKERAAAITFGGKLCPEAQHHPGSPGWALAGEGQLCPHFWGSGGSEMLQKEDGSWHSVKSVDFINPQLQVARSKTFWGLGGFDVVDFGSEERAQ